MHTEVTLLYEAVSNELRDNDSPWGVGTTCDDITKHQEQENNKKEQYSRCQIWVKEFIRNLPPARRPNWSFPCDVVKRPAIRATFLKSVVARITTHLKHCHATKFYFCKLKKFVEKSIAATFATTKFLNEICATTLFNLQRNIEKNCIDEGRYCFIVDYYDKIWLFKIWLLLILKN